MATDDFSMYQWFSFFCFLAGYYVTWGARGDDAPAAGAPLPSHGKPLGKLATDDFQEVIEKGMLNYSKLF